MELDPNHVLRDVAALSELYPPPLERSLRKQIDRLDEYCRAFIAASPLLIVGLVIKQHLLPDRDPAIPDL